MQLLSFQEKLNIIVNSLGINNQDGSYSFSKNELLIKKDFNVIKLFFNDEFVWSSSLDWSTNITITIKSLVLNNIDIILNKEVYKNE